MIGLTAISPLPSEVVFDVKWYIESNARTVGWDRSAAYRGQLHVFPHDIGEFAQAMGMRRDRIPAYYLDPHNNGHVDARYAPLDLETGDPVFPLVRDNLGLFVQWMTFRWTLRGMRSDTSLTERRDVAASSALFAANRGEQNIDWLLNVATEKPARIVLPLSGEGFKHIELALPDGMIGKVCESYAPQASVAQAYLSGVGAIRNLFRTTMNSYRDRAKAQYTIAFEDAAKALSAVIEDPYWTIRDGRLVYERRIEAKRVMFRNTLLDLPEEYRGKLYIENLTVIPSETIERVSGYGRHPHLHLDSEFTSLCVGSFAGKPIANLVDLPEALETIFYSSMYGNTAGRMIEYLFQPRVGQDLAKLYPDLQECLIKAYNEGVSNGEVFKR